MMIKSVWSMLLQLKSDAILSPGTGYTPRAETPITLDEPDVPDAGDAVEGPEVGGLASSASG